jgi:alpha-D-xyloside xylohydrolase
MRKMLDLRYRLLPYIYSEAWQITHNRSTMMRPLTMDFNGDTTALKQPFEYMFGKSLLVAPVTEPNVKDWSVYLPQPSIWYDFWTGKKIKGGQTINTDAPLNKIPLFVRAGSIIPMGKFIQYAGQKLLDTLEIRVYNGADGRFDLYEDEGDSYNYEKGNYTVIPFKWDEKRQTLTIGEKQGSYPGNLTKRIFNIVFVNESEGYGITPAMVKKKVVYTGKETKINEYKY